MSSVQEQAVRMLEQRTLLELAAQGQMPLSSDCIVEIGLWMCDALGSAGKWPHDLSLSNVRVVCDGGIMQRVELPAPVEGTRCVLTEDIASCMSRERACGLASDVRADLYSVGCILFELAEGRPLFIGDLQDVVMKHVIVTPPQPRRAMPALTAIIRCLIEKEPGDRYQTVEELRDALCAVLDDGQSSSRSAA